MPDVHITIDLTEADLLARMKNLEDHLVERKVVSDDKEIAAREVRIRYVTTCSFSVRVCVPALPQ